MAKFYIEDESIELLILLNKIYLSCDQNNNYLSEFENFLKTKCLFTKGGPYLKFDILKNNNFDHCNEFYEKYEFKIIVRKKNINILNIMKDLLILPHDLINIILDFINDAIIVYAYPAIWYDDKIGKRINLILVLDKYVHDLCHGFILEHNDLYTRLFKFGKYTKLFDEFFRESGNLECVQNIQDNCIDDYIQFFDYFINNIYLCKSKFEFLNKKSQINYPRQCKSLQFSVYYTGSKYCNIYGSSIYRPYTFFRHIRNKKMLIDVIIIFKKIINILIYV